MLNLSYCSNYKKLTNTYPLFENMYAILNLVTLQFKKIYVKRHNLKSIIFLKKICMSLLLISTIHLFLLVKY